MQSPKQIADAYVVVGTNKARLRIPQMFVLAVFAGAFIAIAAASAAVASATIDNPSSARLVNALVFPGGLLMVVLAGAELFTGNSLLIIPILEKKIQSRELFRSWTVVYLGNLAGAVLVAFLFVYSHCPGLYDGAMAVNIVNTAATKVNLSFSDAFLRGILCNFLVCTAIWSTTSASTAVGKLIGLYFPVAIFVLAGYEHCIANMYYIPAGIFTAKEYEITAEGLNWGSFFAKNLLPVTLGNMVSGLAVGIGYWFSYLHQNRKAEEEKG